MHLERPVSSVSVRSSPTVVFHKTTAFSVRLGLRQIHVRFSITYIFERFLFQRLFPQADQWWCGVIAPQIVSQAPQHVRSSETDACHHLLLLLCSPVSYISAVYDFLWLRHVQDSTPSDGWVSNVDTCQFGLPVPLVRMAAKLQALVYVILPSTTAVFSYIIGSWKLSANEQFSLVLKQ